MPDRDIRCELKQQYKTAKRRLARKYLVTTF